jgi:hypothetical protein
MPPRTTTKPKKKPSARKNGTGIKRKRVSSGSKVSAKSSSGAGGRKPTPRKRAKKGMRYVVSSCVLGLLG